MVSLLTQSSPRGWGRSADVYLTMQEPRGGRHEHASKGTAAHSCPPPFDRLSPESFLLPTATSPNSHLTRRPPHPTATSPDGSLTQQPPHPTAPYSTPHPRSGRSRSRVRTREPGEPSQATPPVSVVPKPSLTAQPKVARRKATTSALVLAPPVPSVWVRPPWLWLTRARAAASGSPARTASAYSWKSVFQSRGVLLKVVGRTCGGGGGTVKRGRDQWRKQRGGGGGGRGGGRGVSNSSRRNMFPGCGSKHARTTPVENFGREK